MLLIFYRLKIVIIFSFYIQIFLDKSPGGGGYHGYDRKNKRVMKNEKNSQEKL